MRRGMFFSQHKRLILESGRIVISDSGLTFDREVDMIDFSAMRDNENCTMWNKNAVRLS